jgi:hypothetical protein
MRDESLFLFLLKLVLFFLVVPQQHNNGRLSILGYTLHTQYRFRRSPAMVPGRTP